VLGVALLCGLAIVGGMILLIVPGIIAACVLYVAMPASVIEKPGVFGALRRSSDLTRGYRGAMFGLLLIVGVINWLIGKVEQTAFDMSTLANIKTYMYVNCASSIVMGAFTSVLAAVAYYSLRVEKDGTTVDELAAVFS
jgi:hypothetical protein